MGFGFSAANNPCDQVALRLSQVPADVHAKLRRHVPDRWRSETWDPQESVFYLRGTSHYTSGYASSQDTPGLSCLRGVPPDLAYSIYVIIQASVEEIDLPTHIPTERQLWASVLDALLERSKTSLLNITQWDQHLPEVPATAGAKAALSYRDGQIQILRDVIAELNSFLDPIKSNEVSLEEAFPQSSLEPCSA